MTQRLRMLDWLLVAAALTLLIAVIAPHQLPVTAYKLSLVSLAAVAGYRLDRSLFPYARPDSFGNWRDALMVNSVQASVFCASMQRRAIIMAACIVGVSLGA